MKHRLRYYSLFVAIIWFGCTKNEERSLYVIEIDNKFGFIDSIGNVVIEPKYYYASPFSDGISIVMKAPGRYTDGLQDTSVVYYGINSNEEEVFKTNKFIISEFSNGCAVFRSAWSENGEDFNKFGYIGSDGRVIVSAKFNQVLDFSEGLAPVCEDSLWGYINTKGEYTISPRFLKAWQFAEGYAVVQLDGKRLSDKVTPRIFYNEPLDKEPYEEICYDQYAFIDTMGNIVEDSYYNAAGGFSDGLACVIVEARIGFIDTTLSVVIKPEWKNSGSIGIRNTGLTVFSSGLAKVYKDGLYGFINKKGELAIPYQFDEASDFHEGFCTVEKQGIKSIVNEDGIVLVDNILGSGGFSSGLAAIWFVDGGFTNAYINMQGDVVWRHAD